MNHCRIDFQSGAGSETSDDNFHRLASGSDGRGPYGCQCRGLVDFRNLLLVLCLFMGTQTIAQYDPKDSDRWQQITHNAGDDFHCSFSHDGAKVLFDSDRTGHNEIYVYDLATKQTIQITNNSFKSDHPHGSDDGKHIFFDTYDNKEVNINRYDFATNKTTRLTGGLGNIGNAIPNTAGTWVSALGQVNGKYDLFVMKTDGTDRKNLTNSAGDDVSQMWSPDGNRLVYMSMIDGHWQICLINADGTGFKQLTKGDHSNMEPHFSPDGRKIVFVSDRNGGHGIYTIDLAGDKIQKISKDEVGQLEINWLAWSPNGAKILCTLGSENSEEIAFFDMKTGRMQKLTENNFRDTNPSWSPTGNQVVFVSAKSGNLEVYVMNLEKQ